MRGQVSNIQVSELAWQSLTRDGHLRIPGAYSGAEFAELQTAVNDLLQRFPNGVVHTPPYSGIKPVPRKDPPKPTDQTPTLIIPHVGFLDPRLLKPLANPALHGLLERIVGKDFYLSHSWFQKVPPGTGRLSYHKDRRGSINFNILLDDIGPKMGSTCLVPGSHLNTPPVSICMNEPRAPHPLEVDMTGRAGDIVFFSSEAWHGRSENLSNRATHRLFYNFFSRSSRPTTAWNGVVDEMQIEAAKAIIPPAYHHMFEIDPDRTRQLATVHGSRLRRWALGNSSSNEILRDFAYAACVYGQNPASADGHLLPYTSALVEGADFSAFKYLSHMRPAPILKAAMHATLNSVKVKRPAANAAD